MLSDCKGRRIDTGELVATATVTERYCSTGDLGEDELGVEMSLASLFDPGQQGLEV